MQICPFDKTSGRLRGSSCIFCHVGQEGQGLQDSHSVLGQEKHRQQLEKAAAAKITVSLPIINAAGAVHHLKTARKAGMPQTRNLYILAWDPMHVSTHCSYLRA